MIPVSSSMIASVSWDEGTLTVAFARGAVWTYEGVPEPVFDALVSSDSPGRFFLTEIKGMYPAMQVG